MSEFHIAMGQPIAQWPTVPPEERVRLRLRLIAEEFVELCFALGVKDMFESLEKAMTDFDEGIRSARLNVDLVEVADALADLDYVIEGMRLEFGINGKPIADAVHAANMAKTKGPKRADGKQLKPADWTPPDVAGELRKQGWTGQR